MAVETWVNPFTTSSKDLTESTIPDYFSMPSVLEQEESSVPSPIPPTEGQLWPRGNQ